MHKKYSYRNGKRYGPYYYENKRVNGKVVTTYLGADNLFERRRNNLYWIFAVVGLLFIFSVLFIFSEQMNLGILFSPAEPFSISLSQSRFEPGQAVVGELNLQLSKGELIPSEAEVVASLNGVEKSFTLFELLGDEYSISEGNFYLEGSEISGSGNGYGLIGSKETFPDVSFQLRITKPVGTDTEIGGSDVPKEISVESPSETPVEIPAENPAETPVGTPSETPAEVPAENPAASGETVSGAGGDTASEPGASDNSGAGGSESGGDSGTGSESSSSGEGSSGGESSGSSDSGGDSGGEPSLSPELVKTNVRIIEGTVSENSPFIYGLENGWSAELVSGSVKIGDEPVDDGVVSVEENENGLVVSTDYSVLEEGFGQDFLGDETFEMTFGLDKFEFVAPQGDSPLDFHVEYMGQTLFETSEDVISGLVEENITEENGTMEIPGTNETFGNETIEIPITNETFGNETAGNETNLTQLQVVLGQSVIWTKRVNAVGPTTLTIDLPRSAVVLSVEEIASDVLPEEEPPVVEEPQNLPPEIVSKETVAEGTGLEKIEPVVEQTAGELMLSPPEVETQKISVSIDANQVGVDITYETPAAEITSREIAENKLIITVSAPDLGPEHEYRNVLIFDNIPVEFIDKAGSARVYWREGAQYLPVQKVEGGSIFFVAPHLSNQTFEIIFITKAEHLDENRTFVGDVYDLVKARDGSWATIPEEDYLRVSFEKDLTSEKDITIYARANESSKIEVYEKDGIEKIAEFENVLEDKEYKIFLTGLSGEQDTFDLRVVGGNVEFDYVVDPAGICGAGHTNNGDGTCTAKLISNPYLDGVCSISGSCSTIDATGNIGRNPSGYLFRQFYSFDTGDVPLDARIEEAKLSIKTGNSDSFVGSNADRVYFCDYGNSLEFGDFNAYMSGMEALEILEGEIFNSAVNTYGDGVFYNLSVGTSRVNQTGKTQYCLKINNEGGSTWYHEFYFANAPAPEDRPYLDVKYTPGVFTNWCYQENANQAYPPYDGSCGVDYSGSYTCGGPWTDQFSCGYTYDGNWMNGGTASPNPSTAIVEITYRKPVGAEPSSLWKVAYYESNSPAKPQTKYVAIPQSCWNYDQNNLRFKVANYDTGLTFSCYNGGYLSILETGAVGQGSSFREEAMWWNITRTNQLSVNFVSPTAPSGPQPGNSIYVNLSTQSMNKHYSFVDFDRDVKLWMRMDDVNSSGDPTDISSYSRNGTKVNQAAQSSVGYFNKSFAFDGTGDYITLPAGALDSLNNEVTISAWLNDTDTLGVNFFLSFWKSPVENYVLGISHDTEPTPNYFRYENEIDGSGDVNNDISSCRSNRGVWEYWTVVLNSTTQRIYKNGTLCDSRSMIANFSKMDDGFATIIGAYGTGSNGWQGHVDDVLIFGRSLSSDEVLSLYNSAAYKYQNNFTGLTSGAHTFTGYAADELGSRNQTEQRQVFLGADTYPVVYFVPPTPLNDSNSSTNLVYINVSSIDLSDHYTFVDFDDSNVLWMRMDEINSSGDPLDLSGYGNNISKQGNAVQISNGYFGKGFKFDGDGDYLVAKPGNKYPYFDDYGTYTWSMWVNLSQLNRDHWLVSETQWGPPGGYVILVEDNNQVSFAAVSGSGDNSLNYINTTMTLNSGQFYHIVVTFNKESNIKIYIDGIERANGYGYFDDSSFGNAVYFAGTSNSLNGTLDDVAIFNRVLSVDEIKSLYNASAYQYKNNFTNLDNRNYYFTAHAANKAGNKSQTEERLVHLIFSLNPSVRLNLPRNDSLNPIGKAVVLNATVNDVDGGQVTTRAYVVRAQDKSNMNSSVVFNKNVLAGSDMIYNLTAVPVSVSSPGLLSYWNLEDFNGYDVKDVVGKNSLSRWGSQMQIDDGRFGKGFFLDGAADYFFNSSFSGFNRTAGTISFWIRPTQSYLNSAYRTTNLLQSNSELSMVISHYNPGTDVLNVYYPRPSPPPGTISRSLHLSASNWTHIAYTYNIPYYYRIYVNGELVGGEYSPGTEYPPYSSLTSFYIGGDSGTMPVQNDWWGDIDDIAMWKRELNSSDVADLYSLSRGKYYWKVNVTDPQKYSNVSDVWEFNIDNINPYAILRAPPNGTFFKEGIFNITLNASVYGGGIIDSKVYVNQDASRSPIYDSLVFAKNVNSGENVWYNLTALPTSITSSGLVALYRFDNDSRYESAGKSYDYFRGRYNGTWSPGVSYVENGKFARGVSFNKAQGGEIALGDIKELNAVKEFSISAWVVDNALANYSVLFNKFINGSYDIAISKTLEGYNYSLAFEVGSDGLDMAGSYMYFKDYRASVKSGEWYHLVVVYNGSESLPDSRAKMYINGVERTLIHGGRDIPSLTPNLTGVGANISVYSPQRDSWNGSIDEFAIWNRSLSSNDVMDLYRIKAGKYTWSVNVTDSQRNSNLSDIWEFTIERAGKYPYVILVAPPNESIFKEGVFNITLNASVYDDFDNLDVKMYAVNSTDTNNFYKYLLYKLDDVANGTNAIYNFTTLPVDPSSQNLVLLFHFDNDSSKGETGNIIYDWSGHGNNGAGFGGWGYNLSGKFGYGLQMDGINRTYVHVENTPEINIGTLQSKTVSTWFRVNDKNLPRKQVIYEEGGPYRGANIYVYNGLLYIGSYNNQETAWNGSWLTTNKIESNKWHNAVFVLDGGNDSIEQDKVRCYLDGAEFGRLPGSQLYPHSGDITIGAVGTLGHFHDGPINETSELFTFNFNGTIDEVAIWTRNLSADEVEQMYTLRTGQYLWKVNVTDSDGNQNESETRVLNVTGRIRIGQCGVLDQPGQIYQLTKDIGLAPEQPVSMSCFNITAANVVLDGKGFVINGTTSSTTSAGVMIFSSANNAVVKNLNMKNLYRGIWGVTSDNYLIEYNTFEGSGFAGLQLGSTSQNSLVRYNVFRSNPNGIRALANANNNSFEYNSFEGGTEGVYLGPVSNNTLLNNRFVGVGTSIRDEDVTSTNYLLYKNAFGEIRWNDDSPNGLLKNMTVNGDLIFGDSIKLEFDYASLNFSKIQIGKINSSANITLYGVGPRGYSSPVIVRDRKYLCDATTSPSCYNFTSLEEQKILFNVSSWSNYRIMDKASLLYTCGNLAGNKDYVLVQDILNVQGNCFNITGDNVTLDGSGFKIQGDSGKDNFTIYAANVRSISISNLRTENFEVGIYFENVTNSSIENTVGTMHSKNAIYLGNSNFNTLRNNRAFNFSNPGIRLRGSSNNTIEGSLINTTSTGIRIWDSWNNVLSGNVLLNNSGSGIWVTNGSGSQILGNAINLSTENGILVENSTSVLIQNNSLFGNNKNGIYLLYNSNSSLKDTNSYSNTQNGIWISYGFNDVVSNVNSNGNSMHGLNIDSSSNNTFSNITLSNNSASCGVYSINCFNNRFSTVVTSSNSHGLFFVSSYNNVVANVTSDFNGVYALAFTSRSDNNTVLDTSVSAPGYNGIYLSASSNNTFVGGKINGTKREAIILSDLPVAGNVFSNLTLINTNSSFYDFRMVSEGINGTQLMDTAIANYSLNGTGGTVFFKNSQFGEIRFLQPINGTGTNLSNDIRIGNNSAVVLSNVNAGLNKSANITLYGIGNRGFANPQILRDGVPCPIGVCYNFTALNATVVTFNVTGWTNYSIGGEVSMTTCGDLSYGYYKLMNDINGIGGTCFNIVGDYVTLDGQGFMINGSANNDGYGVSSSGRTNLIVRNLTIRNFGNSGIILSVSNSSILVENILLNNANNIGLGGITVTGNKNTIANNTIKSSRFGLYAHGGGNNIFQGNYLENSSSRGIFVELSRNNSFIGGKVINSGQMATAIYVEGTDSGPNAAHDTTFKNVTVTNTSEGYSDIQIRKGANGTSLIDMNLGRYSFNTNLITFENSLYGKVQFLRSITSAGANLSNDIRIGNNSVTVESSSQPGLNVQANITLYGVGNRGFTNTVILKDGFFVCNAQTVPSCNNFTSLTAENVSFNVTSWTSYGIGSLSSMKLSDCGELNISNIYYYLDRDITSAPVVCFNITADNVTLDGKGFRILEGGNIGDAVVARGRTNLTIRNLSVISFSHAGERGVYFENTSNSWVLYNNFTTTFAGFYGLQLSNSKNNRFEENQFKDNAYAITLNGSSWNNLFAGGRIVWSIQGAIILDYDSIGRADNNTFRNITIVPNDPTVYDLTLQNGVEGTVLTDMIVGRYLFKGNKVTFEDSRFGRVKFLEPIIHLLSVGNLSRDVKIGNNSVYVNSSDNIGLNKSALIDLYRIGSRGFSKPTMLRDGVPCPTGVCYNFTALIAENVSFNVTSWTNYSIGDSGVISISSCPYSLNEPNMTYVLAGNLSFSAPTRTCLFINASNIVIDGKGYFVRGSSIRYGISNVLAGVFCGDECYREFDNVTIKNLTVVDFNRNIYFQNMTNSIVKDVVSRSDVYSVYDSLFFRAGINNSVVNSVLYDDGSSRALQFDLTLNTNIINTSVISKGGSGLVFTTTNKTSIVNSYVEGYNFQTLQNGLVFENTRYGKIKFLAGISPQLGTNLSNDIKILNNSVFVDSANRVSLNKSANVTLYSLGNIDTSKFSIPGILRDGRFACTEQTDPSCYNFTSLTAQDVVFNVSSWTNYSIGEGRRPPIVTLGSPANNGNTTNRTLAFNWSIFDPNGDAITNVQINVSCYHFSGGSCSFDGRLIEFGRDTNNYTWQSELWHFYDDQYYYNWTVRASDASGWGDWASERRFNLQSLVEIILLNNSVDFGELKPGNSSSTVNNNPRPLLLQNVGNVLVNVTLNASDLWASPGYGNPNHTYLFKVDNESSALQTAFNPVASIITWTPVPDQTHPLLSIVQFKYNETYTKAEVDLNITVPPAEPVGPRKSTLTFIAGRTS